MVDQDLTQLTETTELDDGDLAYVVRDPSGTPVDRKVTVANLRGEGGGGSDTGNVLGGSATANEDVAVGDTASAAGWADNGALAGGPGADATGHSSVALGKNAVTDGNATVAVGRNSGATSVNAAAVGVDSSADGDSAVAVGDTASASSARDVAVGHDTVASGQASVAVGNAASAAGTSGTAVGDGTSAGGTRSTAIGSGATANSNSATAIGDGASADVHAIALGFDASATGSRSAAIGRNASATNDDEGVLGVDDATFGPSDWKVPGDFTVDGSKNFEIPHPDGSGRRIQHAAYEGPVRGGLIYEGTIEAVDGEVRAELPDYLPSIGRGVRCQATPETLALVAARYDDTTNELIVEADRDVTVHWMVTAERDDPEVQGVLAGVRPEGWRLRGQSARLTATIEHDDGAVETVVYLNPDGIEPTERIDDHIERITVENVREWTAPSGAHDAWNIGQWAEHGGLLWRSKIDGNTTEPGSDDRWWEAPEAANLDS